MSNQLKLEFFVPETSSGARIPAGIHKVTFSGVTYDATSNSSDITFHDATGASARKRLFHEAKVFDGMTAAQAVDARNKKNLGFYYSLYLALLGEDAIKRLPGADTYEVFIRLIENGLATAKGKKVWLKLIMDKEGVYVEFPRYGSWIEEDKEVTTLHISEKELTKAAPKQEADLPF